MDVLSRNRLRSNPLGGTRGIRVLGEDDPKPQME